MDRADPPGEAQRVSPLRSDRKCPRVAMRPLRAGWMTDRHEAMPAPIPPVVAWWARASNAGVRGEGARLGIPCVAPEGGAWALRRRRVEVVHVFLPVEGLASAALATTLGGVLAVLVTPVGAPRALPWWERRFHRYVLPSQAEALAWRAAGVALGRLAVVPGIGGSEAVDGTALRALYVESAAMGRRPVTCRAA